LRNFLNELRLTCAWCVPPFTYNSWNRSQTLGVQKCGVAIVVDVWNWNGKKT
jgi:hypothetical protein